MPADSLGMTVDFLTAMAALSKSDQKATREAIRTLAENDFSRGLRAHKIHHPSGHIVSYSPTVSIRILAHEERDRRVLLFVGQHDVPYEWVRRRKFLYGDGELRILLAPEALEAAPAGPIIAALKKTPPAAETPLADYKARLLALTDDDAALEFIASLPVDETTREQFLELVVQRARGYDLLPKGSVAVLDSDEDLERALQYPLDLWRVFLHPAQRAVAYADPDKSAVLTGGPGTGKTVCIVHRAKHIASQLGDNEVVVVTTYKDALATYLEGMLRKLDVPLDKVILVDIAGFRVLGEEPRDKRLTGFFLVAPEGLDYLERGKRYRVRHVLFDEYQDFRQSQLAGIENLISAAPYTIALDYTQAIYRAPREAVEDLVSAPTNLVRFDRCYRLNSRIVERLRRVVSLIKVLAQHSTNPQGRVPLVAMEEELVGAMRAVVDGPLPALVPYGTSTECAVKLEKIALEMSEQFTRDEAVVTRFFPDIFKSLGEDESFGADAVSGLVRKYYRHAPTLKGKEFKTGVVILDDTACQMLSLNHNVFGQRIGGGWLGGPANFRLALNLVYVALSRFRDSITVLYPAKYGVVIEPMLGE